MCKKCMQVSVLVWKYENSAKMHAGEHINVNI